MRNLAGAAVVAGSMVLVSGAAAGCGLSFGRHTEDRSYTAPGSVDALRVDSDNGSVQVVAVDSPGIKVTEHLRWSNEHNKPKPRHSVSGGTLSLSAKCGHAVIGSNPCRISYRIQVPRSTAVKIGTGNGAITATGLAGKVDLDADNGSITATDLRGGAASVHTGNGPVRVSGRTGTTDLRSDTGSITATGLTAGKLTLGTGSGRVRLGGQVTSADVHSDTGEVRADGLTGERLTVRTGSGSITLGLAAAPDAVRATSDTGSVRLRLPAAQPYAIALSSDTGGKDIAPGIHQDSRSPRHITIKTGSGSISVKPS